MESTERDALLLAAKPLIDLAYRRRYWTGRCDQPFNTGA